MIALKRDIVLFESQILHIDAYTYSYIYKHIYYHRKLAAINHKNDNSNERK